MTSYFIKFTNKTSYWIFFVCIFICQSSFSQIKPSQIYGELFKEIQMNQIFDDSKTFTDCTPNYPSNIILQQYNTESLNADFSLKVFTIYNFSLPEIHISDFKTNTNHSLEEHINILWKVLKHKADTVKNTSLIPLPYPYVVPGGRFREIYYWDSYFTMLGLKETGLDTLCKNMVDNFTYLIEQYGHIPNGNRTYYESRSQPPFYALMLTLNGLDKDPKYLSALKKEHEYWTSKTKIPNPEIYLSRYTDSSPTPRPESFYEDSTLAQESSQNPNDLYTNLRAACESGWDFSSRWFNKDLTDIHTTNIYPVDLNCLLYYQEKILAENGLIDSGIPKKRKKAILEYCWDKEANFFMDYNFEQKKTTNVISVAGLFPLFFKIATNQQAKSVANIVETQLLKGGGVVTTLNATGQQWDYPNGWAPMQYITVEGLSNYEQDKLAEVCKMRFMRTVENTFFKTGKLMEKYNVVEQNLEAGGGEYPGQDGFGWTNGVYLYFLGD